MERCYKKHESDLRTKINQKSDNRKRELIDD